MSKQQHTEQVAAALRQALAAHDQAAIASMKVANRHLREGVRVQAQIEQLQRGATHGHR